VIEFSCYWIYIYIYIYPQLSLPLIKAKVTNHEIHQIPPHPFCPINQWLLFAPLMRNNVDARAILECMVVMKFLKGKNE
jgi:hypothetical protein